MKRAESAAPIVPALVQDGRTKAEKNCSHTEKEALALAFGVTKF